MKFKQKMLLALVGTALTAAFSGASAQTVRIANQGDSLSLDPHSLNESLQLSTTGNAYEPLVDLDKKLNVVPGLATSWKQMSPTLWRFDLRKNVKFYDGTPFTADDVLFTMARIAGDGSDMKSYSNDFKEVRKIDSHTVEIETKTPLAILPQVLTQVMIMSKKWCEENNATRPVDRRKGIENTASFKTNGTGPFHVRERQPGVRTTFVRNPNYWGKIEGNVREAIFTPIASPATRVAALLSGEIDVMEPVPVQDIARVNSNASTRAITGPELRTIFLGMDQKRDELLFSSVKGKNPFKDKRVRQAFYQAIDIEGIKKTVMRDASRPTALMVGPGINGWSAEQDKRPPYDVEAAKKLMAERPLRERRANLPGGGRQPGAHQRQDQPAGRDQGHLLPENPAPRHQLLHAGLDAIHLRRAQRAERLDALPRRQDRRRPVQPWQLLQRQARRPDGEDRRRDRQGQARRHDQGSLPDPQR